MDEPSLAKKDRIGAQDSFDKLLSWLDPDRERAGEKYEQIRQSLIHLFVWRRCADAEALADETIDRVMRRAPELSATYVGDPVRYFYGVAKNLLFEYYRRGKSTVSLSDLESGFDVAHNALDNTENAETSYDCLRQCMQELSPEDRELIVHYYEMKKQGREKVGQLLAAKSGVTLRSLRVRVYRIKFKLKQCIDKCRQEIL